MAAGEHRIPSAESAAVPRGIIGLLEQTHRSVYILLALKRDEMIRQGRGNEMDKMIEAARKVQSVLLPRN